MDIYEEKYKRAIENAKEIIRYYKEHNRGDEAAIEDLETIFPELIEPEGEKIRKALVKFTNENEYKATNYQGEYISKEQMLAWLEKQGEIDKVSYEIAEKEKNDFVGGKFIECRKSFDAFKEDNSYWFEYVGNDTYIGRSDNILNQKFHITPRQLYRLFTQQHRPKENDENEEANASTGYGKYVDECLNEASKHFLSEGEDKYSIADLFYAGVRCGKSWIEKQDEQPYAIRWYDVSLMPKETEELLVEWDGEDSTWHEIAFYHADTKTFWNGERQVENVTRWCYIIDLLENQDEVEKEPEEDKKIRADIAKFIFKSQENIKDRAKWIEYLGYMPTFVSEKNEIQK